MRQRVIQPGDRVYSRRRSCAPSLPGGGAELSPGDRLRHDRGPSRRCPRVHEPHSFNMAWLRPRPGEGVLRHRHDETQVLMVKSGRWRVTLTTATRPQTVELGPQDALSVPAGSLARVPLRRGRRDGPGTGELLVVNSGDGRV